MSAAKSIRGIGLGLIATAVAIIGPSSATAAPAAPAWLPIAVAGPTNLPPSGEGTIAIYAQNAGGLASSGAITVEDELPAGLIASGAPTGAGWSCATAGSGSEVTCTTSAAVGPGLAPKPIFIPVDVTTVSEGTLLNRVVVSGGGAAAAGKYEQSVTISSTPAKPGVEGFTAGAYDADGTVNTQAGSHPYAGVSAIFANTILSPAGLIVPAGDPKTFRGQLAPGFLGNPTATVRCPEGRKDDKCPVESQVGTVQVTVGDFDGGGFGNNVPVAVHAVEAPVGYPAKFTFEVANVFQVNAIGSLRSDEDYGLNVESPNTAQVKAVFGFIFAFWGAPGAATHDDQRCVFISTQGGCAPSAQNVAFLTQPSDCALQAEQPPFVVLGLDTWLTAGQMSSGNYSIPAVEGCDQLELKANFTFEPSDTKSDSPASFRTSLTVPAEGLVDPKKLATPPIRKTVVQLPKGVVLNASGADGLSACSLEQVGFKGSGFPLPNPMRFDKTPNRCPDSSKIGTGELKSALLDNPLKGALYLAAQGEGNPFGSLFAIYLVIEDPSVGIFIKLPGRVDPDPVTGQMTVTFENLPQLPFTRLDLALKGGNYSALGSPSTCGTFVTEAVNTPWSAPESGPPTISSNGFEINQGPNGMPCAKTPQERPFDLGWKAGTDNTKSGASGPFTFNITRPDGSQELDRLELSTPQGLSASLKGIPYCTEAQIAQAEGQTGRQEQSNSACPAASQVGTLQTGAGSGPTPFYVSGKLYLAGPYKGAPISVVAVTPAVAGPFDLGNVVVRNAVHIDRKTAQVSAKSDPIPQLLKGVVLRIRDVRIKLDHKDWTINPTSCEATAVKLKATGNSGATAERSTRYQVGGCENLAFKPKLTANLKGGTKRGDHPAFSATVTYPPGAGYANTKDVQVALPHSEFLDQAHINTICTRVQAAANACPAGAIYGFAEATTPLLDGKLTGPVFLKSSDHQLPDLAIALRGPDSQPVEVEFQGRIDSVKAQIRNTIEGLPDVPVSSFTLKMKGGKKGLLVNSRNLCKGKVTRMTVKMVGQNNKNSESRPPLTRKCKGKVGKKAAKARKSAVKGSNHTGALASLW